VIGITGGARERVLGGGEWKRRLVAGLKGLRIGRGELGIDISTTVLGVWRPGIRNGGREVAFGGYKLETAQWRRSSVVRDRNRRSGFGLKKLGIGRGS
jgi:hypothetical protein